MPLAAESQCNKRGTKMKKVQTRVGFWSWLMGHGSENAGAGG